MCRFVAFKGKDIVQLSDVLDKPANSLVSQSKAAREGIHGVNADGFGIAWYNHNIDNIPGVYKSIQPAWNDANLEHIISKVRSECFLGHVRASTIGNVAFDNCHPFTHKNISMVHNGTIQNFTDIRRLIMNGLDDDLFNSIKGQTDSEHLFYLIVQKMRGSEKTGVDLLMFGVQGAFAEIVKLQSKKDDSHFVRLNIAITDGHNMVVTRYSSKGNSNLSLSYVVGKAIDESSDSHLMIESQKKVSPKAVIIASEPLTDYASEWLEVANDHAISIDKDMNIEVWPLKF